MKTLKSYRLDDRTIESIEDIKTQLHLDSDSETVRKAINFLKFCARAESKGSKVVIVDKDGNQKQVTFEF